MENSQVEQRGIGHPAVPRSDLPATETVADVTAPPLKWAGGKRWLVPILRPMFDAAACVRLVEPFCGGMSVTLGLQPAFGLCNDICAPLINFYRQWGSGLQGEVGGIDEAAYYHHRARFNAILASDDSHTSEAAWLFYVLNKTGYNGLCRFNRKGGFNVPFGKRATGAPLLAAPPLLADIRFTCGPFEQVVLEPGDFVYADPPYDVEFTSYSKESFRWADQQRCAEWLAQHDGPVVLSNQATPRIVALYASLGFTLGYVSAPRRISCNGDRAAAREVLACRNIQVSPALVAA
jgi:DNA adenine methylase